MCLKSRRLPAPYVCVCVRGGCLLFIVSIYSRNKVLLMANAENGGNNEEAAANSVIIFVP